MHVGHGMSLRSFVEVVDVCMYTSRGNVSWVLGYSQITSWITCWSVNWWFIFNYDRRWFNLILMHLLGILKIHHTGCLRPLRLLQRNQHRQDITTETAIDRCLLLRLSGNDGMLMPRQILLSDWHHALPCGEASCYGLSVRESSVGCTG